MPAGGIFGRLQRLPGPLTPRVAGERPRLRLVRSTPEPVGPISPELVLVSPDLAAIVAGTPDAVTAGGPDEPDATGDEPRSSGRLPGGPTRYDTRDLLLERHGVELDLQPGEGGSVWRLTLPRGEQVEVPGAPGSVPRRITTLLVALLGDAELRSVPARSSDPEIQQLERRLLDQRRSLIAHDAGTRLGIDAENLHQLRVAGRRARAFLKVARELVDPTWADALNGPLRALGQASGPARDLDVLLEQLRGEIATLGPQDAEPAARLLRQLERDRDDAQTALEELLDSASHHALLEDLALPAAAGAGQADRTLAQLAARELRRLVGQVQALGKHPPEERLHELRIRVKRVRYAAELGGLPGGSRTARVIAAATALQDLLGAHQDTLVAEERIRGLADRTDDTQAAFAAGRLAERQRRRREELHRRLPDAWQQLRRVAKGL